MKVILTAILTAIAVAVAAGQSINIPPTCVAVQVMRVDRESHLLRLLGWTYLDADMVNALHGIVTNDAVVMRTL